MTDDPSANPIKKVARITAENVSVTADKAVWGAADRWPIFSFLVEWRERRYARLQSAELCEIYQRHRAENPSLGKEALYEKVVVERLKCTPAQARDVIRGADQSFAQWPEERDVIFRDVANYLITHQLMAAHDKSLGTRADMLELFKDEIPGSL